MTVETGVCSGTALGTNTATALKDAISSASGTNGFIRDADRKLACDSEDITAGNVVTPIQIQIGEECFTHVHQDHLSIFDFSGWVHNHPGGSYNIMKWAEGWEGHEGWYLDFPLNGNSTRKIPKHPMSRWTNNANGMYLFLPASQSNVCLSSIVKLTAPNIEYVGIGGPAQK